MLVTDAPSFYVYRMDYRDEAGHAPAHHRRHGRARAQPAGRGRHPPPRAHDAEGQERPPEPALRSTAGQPVRRSGACHRPPGLSEPPGDRREAHRVRGPTTTGITHTLLGRAATRAAWRRSPPRWRSSPVVIADGHHRYETSLAYRDERRAADGPTGGADDSVLTYVVELVDDQLTVLPIHRLISGPARRASTWRAALDRLLHRHPGGSGRRRASPASMREPGLPGAGAGLGHVAAHAPPRRLRRPAATSTPSASTPPSRPCRAHELVFQHGVDNVVRAVVDQGEAQAGVLLRPATVRQIVAIAHGGERMPPKTTFFHPKPRTGVVFRSLG